MSQLTIYYILNARWPTTRAYGLQVAKMCQGFTQVGVRVRLIVPTRAPSKETYGVNPFVFYGIRDCFSIVQLPSIDVVAWGIANRITFTLQQALFACCAAIYLIGKNGIIYSRDPFTLFLMSFLRRDMIWEVHRVPPQITSWFYRRLLAHVRGIVCITEGIRKKFIEQRVTLEKVMVAPDGIDLAEFKEVSRRTVYTNIDPAKHIVLYTGQLMKWKGVDTLVRAAQLLDESYQVVVVGGTATDIERLKELDIHTRVRWIDFLPHADVLRWLAVAEVLILPNKKDAGVSEFYTSPLKMFEYMAAGKPIVASALPSICEMLNEDNAILVQPDNPQALAEGIQQTIADPKLAHQRAEQACADVQQYTWHQRAGRILQFIQQ